MSIILNVDELLKINYIPINNLCEELMRDVTSKKTRQILKYYRNFPKKRKFEEFN